MDDDYNISMLEARARRIGEQMKKRNSRAVNEQFEKILDVLRQVWSPTTGGVPVTSVPPLAGDVDGKIQENTVRAIQSIPVSTTDPATGQALLYDGTRYTPGEVITPAELVAELTSALVAYIAKSLIDAKGDLVVGNADNTPIRLGVGTNGQILYADSTQPGGLRWGDPPEGGSGSGIRYEPLTNGDPDNPQLIFDATGDVIMVPVP